MRKTILAAALLAGIGGWAVAAPYGAEAGEAKSQVEDCLLYTSDAADE